MTSLIKERRRRRTWAPPRRSPQQRRMTREPKWEMIAPGPERLIEEICLIMSVKIEDVRGRCRDGELVKVRAAYAHLGGMCGFSASEMGRSINRDHATILFHQRKYRECLEEGKPWFKPDTKEYIDNIIQSLKTRLIMC